MISVRDVHICLEGWPVLQGIDLAIAQGEIVCLLGPSGCGKTTMLRVIAGLERPDKGDLLLEGTSILHVPVYERGFGLMFQDHALFPHLTVAGNIAFGLRMHGASRFDQVRRVFELLDLVNLQGFEARVIGGLSGGERQRVALARSLAPGPRFLMLDEPLGALDAALRAELIGELRAIIKKAGLTALYVTHDQQEAFVIADRMAVMNAGRIEQIGPPDHVYRSPTTVFTATFLGLTNIFHRERLCSEERTGGVFSGLVSSSLFPSHFLYSDDYDAFLLHPDFMAASPVDQGHLSGQVIDCTFAGSAYRVQVRLADGTSIFFRAPAASGILERETEVGLRLLPGCVIPLRS